MLCRGKADQVHSLASFDRRKSQNGFLLSLDRQASRVEHDRLTFWMSELAGKFDFKFDLMQCDIASVTNRDFHFDIIPDVDSVEILNVTRKCGVILDSFRRYRRHLLKLGWPTDFGVRRDLGSGDDSCSLDQPMASFRNPF